MGSFIQQMPSLGYFNKIICDSLGLWSTDKKDILFAVPATEKERRKALKDAFAAIQKDDGSYGSHDELISETTKNHPKQKAIVKKNKTIQDYTNHLSKEDFSSPYEFIEVSEYVNIVIGDKFTDKELYKFVSEFYALSIMYYREFIREHAVKPKAQLDSYLFFVKNILIRLIASLNYRASTKACSKNYEGIVNDLDEWPLRTFVDSMADLCGVSLYKLHQFHEFRLNNKKYSDKKIWEIDLASQPTNTRSKQVIERLKKPNKIKWDTFYDIVKPLIPILPKDTDKETFRVKAYAAFLTHNIKNHIRKITLSDKIDMLPSQDWNYPEIEVENSCIPISDRIDSMLNNVEGVDKVAVQASMDRYHSLTKRLVHTNLSLLHDFEVPNTLVLLYSKQLVDVPIDVLLKKLKKAPLWLKEMSLARNSVKSRKPVSALQHYKKSLEAAKYSAGPLFVLLYIDICAFCKNQYHELKKRNEEDLFDRFYDPLGSEVTKYADLLGYTPSFSRDPITLIPKSNASKKDGLIVHKIDTMAGMLAKI
ncbi:MAG: hypothetical protein AB7D06_13275 [Pedobacter sp.]